MRKAMMASLFAMLCSLTAFGQSQPQWKVIYSVAVFRQIMPIPETTIFTPTEVGQYRITTYFSQTGISGKRNFFFRWTDINGDGFSLGATTTYPFIPKIGVPVTYDVEGNGGTYSLAFTVEQLQSSVD